MFVGKTTKPSHLKAIGWGQLLNWFLWHCSMHSMYLVLLWGIATWHLAFWMECFKLWTGKCRYGLWFHDCIHCDQCAISNQLNTYDPIVLQCTWCLKVQSQLQIQIMWILHFVWFRKLLMEHDNFNPVLSKTKNAMLLIRFGICIYMNHKSVYLKLSILNFCIP